MNIIACHDCDLIQQVTPLPPGGKAVCRRCGAVLYRHHPDSLSRTLAFTLGATVSFVIANTFPIVTLEVAGQRNATTLLEAILRLRDQEMPLVALLVFLTTFLLPALGLLTTLGILLRLRLGRTASHLAPLLRFLQQVQPWGMVEVFMIGVLVALVKLTHLASVIPGIALWSYASLVLLLAAASASFDPRPIWEAMEIRSPETTSPSSGVREAG